MSIRYRGGAYGFTLVELLIVIVVIGIIATIGATMYQGVQRRAATSSIKGTLSEAQKAVHIETTITDEQPVVLPTTFHAHDDVQVIYRTMGEHYSGLSPVQNGVLFHRICTELITDPYYATIHARLGGATNTVMMGCDSNIEDDRILITGWDSRTWTTPLTKETLEEYVASVPYDSWWIDRQDVVRGFYQTLIDRFEQQGGTWPITSFWDPWANEWSGVHKQELPEPDNTGSGYCIEAVHRRYTDVRYAVNSNNQTIREGSCE